MIDHPPLPEAEVKLLDRVTELAAGFADTAAAYDERAEIPAANLRALHEAGADRAVLPEWVGGTGLSYRGFGRLLRVLAAADASTATIWLMHAGAAVGLAEFTRETLGPFSPKNYWQVNVSRTLCPNRPAATDFSIRSRTRSPRRAAGRSAVRNVSSPAPRSPTI
ncbi:acyl-CoA dehydrogenase family protein [Nocardia sp. NPDC050435]|uniref:acyl-CoA dehydrogenase family protein n=1 Tax=Nocardia sp. NPDC050435 TaxID=3155040 RepID=UPI00341142FC